MSTINLSLIRFNKSLPAAAIACYGIRIGSIVEGNFKELSFFSNTPIVFLMAAGLV